MDKIIRVNYRDLALKTYTDGLCTHCGFGVKELLEVAHLDQNRANNAIDNLAVLCPNCHKMHDLGLIPTDVIRQMRAHTKVPVWKLRMKDAGAKAGAKRKENTAKKRRSDVANKAVATRLVNAAKN